MQIAPSDFQVGAPASYPEVYLLLLPPPSWASLLLPKHAYLPDYDQAKLGQLQYRLDHYSLSSVMLKCNAIGFKFKPFWHLICSEGKV